MSNVAPSEFKQTRADISERRNEIEKPSRSLRASFAGVYEGIQDILIFVSHGVLCVYADEDISVATLDGLSV